MDGSDYRDSVITPDDLKIELKPGEYLTGTLTLFVKVYRNATLDASNIAENKLVVKIDGSSKEFTDSDYVRLQPVNVSVNKFVIATGELSLFKGYRNFEVSKEYTKDGGSVLSDDLKSQFFDPGEWSSYTEYISQISSVYAQEVLENRSRFERATYSDNDKIYDPVNITNICDVVDDRCTYYPVVVFAIEVTNKGSKDFTVTYDYDQLESYGKKEVISSSDNQVIRVGETRTYIYVWCSTSLTDITKKGILANTYSLSQVEVQGKKCNVYQTAHDYLVIDGGDSLLTKTVQSVKKADGTVTSMRYTTNGTPVVEVGDIIVYQFNIKTNHKSHKETITNYTGHGPGGKGHPQYEKKEQTCENSITYISFEDYFDTNYLSIVDTSPGLGYRLKDGRFEFSAGISSGGGNLGTGEVTFNVEMQVISEPPKDRAGYYIQNVASLTSCKIECFSYKDHACGGKDEGCETKTKYILFKCDTGGMSRQKVYVSGYEVGLQVFISKTLNSQGVTKAEYNRASMSMDNKKQSPVSNLENGDYVEVTYRIKNNSQYNMVTNVVIDLKDGVCIQGNNVPSSMMPNGVDSGIQFDRVIKGEFVQNNRYKCTEKLAPGGSADIVIRYRIEKTNMFLYMLKWKGELTKFENGNGDGVHNTNNQYTWSSNSLVGENGILYNLMKYDLNKNNNQDEDYAQLKELLVAGNVWVDNNVDGIKAGESGLGGINVYLKKGSGDNTEVVASTITDANGFYQFQDVQRATNKDGNGRYSANSRYIDYYIEFEYNGHKYASTVYSGTTGTAQEGIVENSNYENLSHAAEFKQTRKEFNEKLGIISDANGDLYPQTVTTYAYNGTKANQTGQIKYNAYENHASTIADVDVNPNLYIRARSFINDDKYAANQGSKNLFLYVGGSDYYFFNSYADTEYLKYINLGLRERAKLDLELEQTLNKIETSINGKTAVYDYDVANSTSDGYISYYQFAVYNADYQYRTEKYSDGIADFKGGDNNNLNVDITYKITVTNNSMYYQDQYVDPSMSDEPYMACQINEIVNFYSNFTTYKSGKYTFKESDGTQREGLIEVGNPRFLNNNSSRTRTLEADCDINGEVKHAGESYVNIRAQSVYLNHSEKLDKGESIDIYLTYSLNKNGQKYIYTKANLPKDLPYIYNYSEIATYSTYYTGVDSYGFAQDLATPGLVDCDSVANNISGWYYQSSMFEDDIQANGLIINILRDQNNPDNPDDPDNPEDFPGGSDPNGKYMRKISGNVWEDLRTEERSSGQVVGDGLKIREDGIENMTVKLMEVVMDSAGEEYIVDTGIETKTNNRGNYTLEGFVPGNYVVRFIYGDQMTSVPGEEGVYKVAYSGQDYKSTAYTDISTGSMNNVKENLIDASEYNRFGGSGDKKSYAKDSELRRLETVEYSKTITNPFDKILKGIGTEDEMKELVNNTAMYADTKEFKIEVEYTQSKDGSAGVRFNPLLVLENSYLLKNLIDQTRNTPFIADAERYHISNVNFGIEERPITKLQLLNDIKRITIITSDNQTLVDLLYDITYHYKNEGNKTFEEANIKNIIQNSLKASSVVKLNEKNSIGYERVQSVDNKGNIQGFRYINLDEDVMQGTTIRIEYQMAVVNISEVDTSNNNLRSLVEQGKLAEVLNNTSPLGKVTKVHYRYGDGTNTNNNLCSSYTYHNLDEAIQQYYEIYKTNNNDYLAHAKDTSGNDISNKYFYGYFLGSTYYTGNNGYNHVVDNPDENSYYYYYYYEDDHPDTENDGVIYTIQGSDNNIILYEANKDRDVTTRIDQVLDIVDNSLVFNPVINVTDSGAAKWKGLTQKEIAGITEDFEEDDTEQSEDTEEVIHNPKQQLLGFPAVTNEDLYQQMEEVGSIEQNLFEMKGNTEVQYITDTKTNLPVSVEDKQINGELYKFLDTTDTLGMQPEAKNRTRDNISRNEIQIQNQNENTYHITLNVSRVISPMVDGNDDLSYNNIAEIVKFTNTVGRRGLIIEDDTRNIGTMGNSVFGVNGKLTNIGLVNSEILSEIDTDFTEQIKLVPPTGLELMRYYQDTIMKIVLVIAIGMASVIIGIKIKTHKKIYK